MAISLSSLKRGRSIEAPRIIVYGVNGIGKSTFGAQSDSPIFIPAEDGLGLLDVARFPRPESISDVTESLKALADEPHEFKTVVLDTTDEIERLIFAQVALDHGKKSIEEIGYAKGYVFAHSYWQKILDALDALRQLKGMASILIAHSLIKAYTPPDNDPFDRYRFDLHDKSASILRDWADVILFANYKVYLKKTGQGFDEHVRAVGQGERIMFTEERPAHWAKNRYCLPYELPFSWEAFKNAMTESVNK
jgi:hypothetical protein